MLHAPCVVPATVLRDVVRAAPGCATIRSEAACLVLYEIDYNTHVLGELQSEDALDRAALAQWCDCGRPLPDIIDMRMAQHAATSPR